MTPSDRNVCNFIGRPSKGTNEKLDGTKSFKCGKTILILLHHNLLPRKYCVSRVTETEDLNREPIRKVLYPGPSPPVTYLFTTQTSQVSIKHLQ